MFANWKKNRQIKKIKKGLTEREQAIFDFIYSHQNGASKTSVERATGYKVSGWVITKFKEAGVNLKTKNKKYIIELPEE